MSDIIAEYAGLDPQAVHLALAWLPAALAPANLLLLWRVAAWGCRRVAGALERRRRRREIALRELVLKYMGEWSPVVAAPSATGKIVTTSDWTRPT